MGLWRAMLAREPRAVVRLMEEMAGCTMNFSSCSKAALPSSHRTSNGEEERLSQWGPTVNLTRWRSTLTAQQALEQHCSQSGPPESTVMFWCKHTELILQENEYSKLHVYLQKTL